MVTKLQRKLLRDLWTMRGQVLAIIAVVACGIASYVSMLSVHASLADAGAAYFERHRFPDVFARVAYAPRSLAARLAEIPGVDAVETRLVHTATIDVEGLAEPAVARLVSLPPPGRAAFNVLHIETGRLPDPSQPREVVVSKAFAAAHQLPLGAELPALIGGRRFAMRVVGTALSPEYVYSIGEGSIFPDPKRFGVFWMGERALATVIDKEGGFNDVTLSLARGASERDVIAAIDVVLHPYGGRGAYGRDKQPSARFIDEELKQLASMGAAVPIMFLAVAAFLLNVVLARLIAGQREQIAALKALGYANLAIGIHYCEMMVVIVLGGTVAGVAAGGVLGDALITLYHQYFAFPDLRFTMQPELVARAAALSVAAGFVGVITAVRRAVVLPPAEAMRPQAPTRYTRGWLSRIGLEHVFGHTGRIVLRNIERRPVRTIMSSLGVAFAIAIMIAGTFSLDSLAYIMDITYQRAQRDDVTVAFAKTLPIRVLHELESLPGVLRVEPSRDVPIRLRSRNREYETVLQGLPQRGELRRLLTADLDQIELPESGVLLTDVLATRLGVQPGDALEVEILEGRPRSRQVAVVGVVDEVLGLNAYAEIGAVNSLLGEGRMVGGARLLVDPDARDEIYVRLQNLPQIGSATLRTSAYEAFLETSGATQTATAVILGALAAIVAIGVVYNGARVVLAERSRELASLRVIGFTRVEVSTILLGELGVQLVAAVPLGCLMGYGLARSLIAGIDTELYRFPLIISAKTYVVASLVALVAGTAAALLVRRRVDRLDLVEVLKTRE
jgi:putative ABC transport system permease protein